MAPRGPQRVLGIYRKNRILPTDRRIKEEWRVPPSCDAGAQPGEIVLAEPMPHHGFGLPSARVVERLGTLGDARSISLIAIHTHDLPTVFPPEAARQAAEAREIALGARTDLRGTRLVTIDGEDARDFDDAVYAEPDGVGFRVVIAIADVAHYVRPGSALDEEARKRGNSVYFPDRVAPMLPEALSNGWCSLLPGQERLCVYVELRIDASGAKTAHRFGRGLMRSAARLTYEQVQEAHDAGNDLDLQLASLYGAFRVLLEGRRGRGTLDLDVPERKVVLDGRGHVAAVSPRPRLDSHRLIEEFMILANVAAAEELESRHAPCLYRVHAPPSDEKLANLRVFLKGFGVSLPPAPSPGDLDGVLKRTAGREEGPLVHEVMLRSQSQAGYSPDNIGHFGLSLPRYAHFTSPIRRYADLLVHRSLIGALRFEQDGLEPGGAVGKENDAYSPAARAETAAVYPLGSERAWKRNSKTGRASTFSRGPRRGRGGLTLPEHARPLHPQEVVARPADGDGAASLAQLAEHLTMTERRAARAERDATDRYLAAYLADRVGATFSARISGVTRFAIFVTLAYNGANGIVPISTLPDDDWKYEESTHSLTGRRTRLTFRLAQLVEVRLAEANAVTGGLVFHILQGDGGRKPVGAARKRGRQRSRLA